MTLRRDIGRTVLLCVIGGSADSVAYLRFGTFVGAMTGNTVLLGIDLTAGNRGAAFYHACIIIAFLLAVVAAQSAIIAKMPASLLLAFTAIMLAGATAIDSKWGAIISAAALGVQNGGIRKIAGVSINTVFITGDLVALGSALPQAQASEQQHKMLLLTIACLAYAAGAVIGAAAQAWTRYAMAIPAILAGIAALTEARRSA